MGRYAARRVLLMIPTALGAAAIIFVILRILPGDVATLMVTGPGQDVLLVDPVIVAAIREDLGLNDPLYVQFGRWLWGLVRGDWGESYYTSQPIGEILASSYPVTLQLGIMSVIVSVLIGLPAGVISAVKQDTLSDYISRVLSIVGLAMPGFWLGLLVITFLITFFQWFPELTYVAPWENPAINFSQFIFPAVVLGASHAAVISRMTRSALLEVLREDYVRTAHAKGLRPSTVLIRHALRNALIPVITIAGTQFGSVIGGAVVIEVVFNLHGIGAVLIEAIAGRDIPLVETLVLLLVVGFLVVNLLVDLLYGVLNPRIRYQ